MDNILLYVFTKEELWIMSIKFSIAMKMILIIGVILSLLVWLLIFIIIIID